ncbi:hypothetical protein JJB67_15640 [Clostridium perfringens]|uniref:hypothetical protein n=1 Tax=Clostridium perfringens TaxID=1502 RepID=UPI001ABA4904|nr:hypothetical protein [Clostridium perfringens]MBO3323652.1 hypothetical protein [Clostridium perfringens]MBO3332867.1 hypothetical protein [Clostridium perfringens]MCX0386730.1 hypothetical protein [Clostridium perfringens]
MISKIRSFIEEHPILSLIMFAIFALILLYLFVVFANFMFENFLGTSYQISFLRDIVGIKNGKIDMITGISILILGSLGILLIIFNCLKKN